MSFRTRMQSDDGVVTIWLAGELDSQAAPDFNELIAGAADLHPRKLVLLTDDLTYMSSAGLRSLVFAHQKMPPGMEIVLIGARPEVAETIRLTGFDRSIVMQEATEPR
jgi:anti-anti-sigma factor